MSSETVVLVQGACGAQDVPGLGAVADAVTLRFATDAVQLREGIRGAQVLLGWDFREASVESVWQYADRLRWVHWAGAGVDAVLFPALIRSDVVLTNSRGVFDRAMAEYVLGLIIAFAKGLPQTLALQAERTWKHRLTECIDDRRALIVGVGSIGRCIARLLVNAGLQITGVGTRARSDDPDFGTVHPQSALDGLLGEADYVVAVTPLTPQTTGLFDAARFRAMKRTARFINVGRGRVVDETALVEALEQGEIAGAALDVFVHEPLPADSPLWRLPNVIVSPHMSGDFEDYDQHLARVFLNNLARFRAGEPLLNVVDKSRGYVR